MNGKLAVLPEPTLRFKATTHTYCKAGLTEDGPYSASLQTHPKKVLIGVIGPRDLAYKATQWIERWEQGIVSEPGVPSSSPGPHRKDFNKVLFPDFPGLPSAFHTSFICDESLRRDVEAKDWNSASEHNEIDRTTQIYEHKLLELCDNTDTRPELAVLLLPDDVTRRVGDYHQRLTRRRAVDTNQLNLFGDFDSHDSGLRLDKPVARDLRGSLKCMAMKHKIPVQILAERTLRVDDPSAQNEATKVWNLSTGMFYKAGHLPWVLENADRRTCFLGISYYHSKTVASDAVCTAVAQLFSNEYESPVIRGTDTLLDPSGNPRVSYDQARRLLEKAISEHQRLKRELPRRLVIHKSWGYSEEERRAIQDYMRDKGISYDAVSLTKSTLRVLRYSKWPVHRGSFLRTTDSEGFLYTKGYVPDLKTYPGVHVPAPFHVRKVDGDSDLQELCVEILALTKLNWNSADYCCGLPLTLSFARSVGKILRELQDGDPWEGKYCYYM